MFITVSLPIIYGSFALILFKKYMLGTSNTSRTNSQKMVTKWKLFSICRNKFQIFLQVFLIALINVLTTAISVAFQLNLINEMEWLTTMEMFLYMQAHGSIFLWIIYQCVFHKEPGYWYNPCNFFTVKNLFCQRTFLPVTFLRDKLSRNKIRRNKLR